FLHVPPVLLVTLLGEMLRADVGVEPVGQRVANRFHVSAGAARGFEQRYVVPALHQFVRATESTDAPTCDDDSLARCRRGGNQPAAGQQGETGSFQDVTTGIGLGSVHGGEDGGESRDSPTCIRIPASVGFLVTVASVTSLP